jgi:TonB-linked SusC/RagA family outer membrane protein
MAKKIPLMALLGLWTLAAHAQNKMVSGHVYDTDGQPLPGATVQLKEGSAFALTDPTGSFSIGVPESAFEKGTLVFSFMGFVTQEMAINGRANIDVRLREDRQALDEVVVTAIGIERDKKAVGYAVQDVKSTEMNRSMEGNVINTLNSKVAGVQITAASGSPGASTAIRIRGNSSIQGNNEPLFVVDGIPVDNSYRGSNFTDQANRLVDLNPGDIESITVLKGPAASALYGINASNGAIIITTKRGKAGKVVVNVNSSIMVDQVNRLPRMQQLFSQGSQGVYRGPETGTNSTWGPLLSTLRYDGDPNFRYDRRGRLVDQNDPSATDLGVSAYPNLDNFFTPALSLNNSVSISGGNEVSQFYMSAAHFNQDGVVPLTDFNRTSVKVSGSTVYNKLTVTGSATYARSTANRSQRGSNLSGVMLGLLRTPASFDLANGYDDPVNTPAAYSFPDGTQRTFFDSYDNPYWSINKNRSLEETDRIVGFGELKYAFSPRFQATYRLGLDQYSSIGKSWWDNESSEFGTGRLFEERVSNRILNSDLILSFNQQFNPDWGMTALVGHNYRKDVDNTMGVEGFGFVLPQFYDISNINIQDVTYLDDFIFQTALVGVYADVQLDYKSWLFLNVTARNDWTSTLPAGSNSFFYPSASLGFVFTEAWRGTSFGPLDFGKIRLSYAQVGNGAPSPYLTSNVYVATDPTQGLLSYTPANTLAGTGLVPETKYSYEVGGDFRFFGNRLQLDLNWYNTQSTNQILTLPLATSTGFTSVVGNASDLIIENTGIEAVLGAQIIEPANGQGFSWNANLNFTRNRNTVKALNGADINYNLGSTGLASTSSRVISNQPYGVLYGTQWERDDQGRILVNNNGYPILSADMGVVGDPNPDFLIGFRNTLAWKGFELSFLLDIRKGGDLFNGTAGVMRRLGTHVDTESRNEEVVFEGVNATTGLPNDVPIRLDENFYSRYPLAGVSEASIEEVNWLRMRDLGLTYRFSGAWMQRAHIQALSVGIMTRNLFLITSYSGIDPETNLSGADNALGRDYFNNPNTRSYGMTVNITF